MLLEMKELALILMAMRKKRGSIDFDLPEPEIIIGLTGQTEGIIRAERNLAHQLIEEFMLAANEAVAALHHRPGHPLPVPGPREPRPGQTDQLPGICLRLRLRIRAGGGDRSSRPTCSACWPRPRDAPKSA